MVVIRTRSNALRSSRFSSTVADAGVVVEDVMGNGGYFGRRNVLKFSVTAAARNDGWSSGQVKGLCGPAGDAVLNLLEQAPAKCCRGCLV